MTDLKKAATEEDIARYINFCEVRGDLDPECPTCQKVFYPVLRAGEGWPFAPGHKASARCESGKRPHCTCDCCF
jgi:hypothetical protein